MSSTLIHVEPERSGFFGLTQLEAFTRLKIEPSIKAMSGSTVTMDFSTVRIWDIAALLWLTVALDHYRRNAGISYILRLPQGSDQMSSGDRDAFDRSADYLRRWRFDRALQNIEADVSKLLVSDQHDYFDPGEPRRFYLAKKVQEEPSGLLQSLISRRLAEIRDLSDPSFTGKTPISAQRITQCVREFQAERIGDILAAQCKIEKRKADLFSDHLLTEALLNVQEHPNASIGMVAISLMGNTKELVLSVVDNGDSIPQTIFERYVQDLGDDDRRVIGQKYDRDTMTRDQRAEIAHYATMKGVTRKKGAVAENAGMGLTYIKQDSVATFGGKLTIVTDKVRMIYKEDPDHNPDVVDWPHPWRGNLLRISIPLG